MAPISRELVPSKTRFVSGHGFLAVPKEKITEKGFWPLWLHGQTRAAEAIQDGGSSGIVETMPWYESFLNFHFFKLHHYHSPELLTTN
jgi:hypothetical protein